ncbi:histidine ammonia-lyase [Bacteroidales bacterium OttesenSCG-928-B11]|nr:histidine ammonia-lyase [Bacteroidales bacterium OttesenSCG-928-E04]MDL2308203.1 histidine ammonia-lyase [Bacteroidales bacterium OttesenSCG-928-C03]MDL2312583.1 histidine ammonia-lyase [Bacteroidales bacterium OttesenSCG-928-B11]MDL2325641.1 histidine ammonia-lyase [Bacteroidales bacterium OttesenSCG-928-A14]
MKKHLIKDENLSIDIIEEILDSNAKIELSEEARGAVAKCRAFLDEKMKKSKTPVYGITTGFGSLCNTTISVEDLSTLQRNLVISHACGMGEEVPQEIVRIMLLLKIQSLSYGYSGVQVATIQRLIDLFNKKVYPVVYQQGSLGASGDLAPLAHLSLPIIGLGEVYYKGKKYPATEINDKFGWEPIELQSKEGLALLNGTQFMSAYAVWLLMKAEKLSILADRIGAVSLDAFDGRIEPFHLAVHLVRPHFGQLMTATHISTIMEGSEIIRREKKHVQDPYSFRCIPQVHGATKDTITHVREVVEVEINSATDNPTVFPDEDMIISAGNFHGQPLALVLDFLTIAMAELGNISERRVYQLISGKRDLPSFLVKNPGLNSGFMIPQYTAASIVNQNKSLTMPCSTDSIESSQGQEDHVSMGANAATKAYRVLDNVEKILAIELLNAAQALEFRRPLKSSEMIEELVAGFREVVPFVENDTVMYELMHNAKRFLEDYKLNEDDKDFV